MMVFDINLQQTFHYKFFIKLYIIFCLYIACNILGFAHAGIYFKGFYNGVHISDAEVTDAKTDQLDSSFIKNAKNKFQQNFYTSGGGIAAGFAAGSLALEIEAIFPQKIKIEDTKVFFKDASGDTLKIANYLHKNIQDDQFNALHNDANYLAANEALHDKYTSDNHQQKIKLLYKNETFRYSATMLNLYYNLPIVSEVISLYGAGGFGFSKVDLDDADDKYPLTLQWKFGASLGLSRIFAPYIGYRGVKITSKTYPQDKVYSVFKISEVDRVYKKIAQAGSKGKDTIVTDIDLSKKNNNSEQGFKASYLLHGIEVGLMIYI